MVLNQQIPRMIMIKRNSLNSSYNPVTRMYENAVGKFLTYAEARQKQWQCEKCGE